MTRLDKAVVVQRGVKPRSGGVLSDCPSHELLHCTRSKAHNFKEQGEGKTMQIGVRNTHCNNALPKQQPAAYPLFACCLHAHGSASRECCG